MRTQKLSLTLTMMLILVMLLSACAQPATTPIETAPLTVPPTEWPTLESTEAPEPATATPFPIPLPSNGQVNAIIDGVTNLSSQGVPAPENSIAALQVICNDLAGDLVKPESCGTGFRQNQTSTYTLQEDNQTGVFFQMVSLNESVNDWLDPEKDWGDKRLLVGGWLTPTDVRVVLLNRKNGELMYDLVDASGSPSETGSWQLRSLNKLPSPPPEGQVIQKPYTFIAPEQACYSFTNYQACLNRVAPGFGGESNQVKIQSAVKELKDAGQLPSDFEQVDWDGAVASIVGSQAEEGCSQYGTCRPSMISAHSEWPFDELPPTSGSVTEVLPAVSIVSVVEPISGFVTDSVGASVALPSGSYRVDLLHTSDDKWISQFVGSDGKTYYALAKPLVVSGTAIMGGDAEQNLLLFSGGGIWVCVKNGTGSRCNTLFCRSEKCRWQWYGW